LFPRRSAFNSGSTGADGALAPAVPTFEVQVPESGVLNYTSINIPQGTTVKFKKNRLNTPAATPRDLVGHQDRDGHG
jgi:hypothetical protein